MRILAAAALLWALAIGPPPAFAAPGGSVVGTWAFDQASVEAMARREMAAMLEELPADQRAAVNDNYDAVKQEMMAMYGGTLAFTADGRVLATTAEGETDREGSWRMEGDTVVFLAEDEDGNPESRTEARVDGDALLFLRSGPPEGGPEMADFPLKLVRR
jgi:hypothetical protein